MLMDTVRELCAIDGVSSFEDGVREYIKSRIEPYADSVFQDAMGNLIAFKKGARDTGKTVLIAAHMDEAVSYTHLVRLAFSLTTAFRWTCATPQLRIVRSTVPTR